MGIIMPMPLWWGHINKHVFNRMALKRDSWPVITHVGRTSGKVYRTPLEVHRIDGGVVFILVYGSGSDWVKNILASGEATLTTKGKEEKLVAPRLISEQDAWATMPADTKRPPKMLNVGEFLQMDISA